MKGGIAFFAYHTEKATFRMVMDSRPADFRIFANAKVQKLWEIHKLLLQKQWHGKGWVAYVVGWIIFNNISFYFDLKPICVNFAAMKIHPVSFTKLFLGWLSPVFIAVLMMCACSSSSSDEMIEEPDENDSFEIGYHGRLDFDGDTLRVLILGNSFSGDATSYLKEVADGAGLDRNRFCVYNGMISGGGMTDWIKTLESGVERSIYRMAGAIKMNVSGPLEDVLNQPWDVCVLLQNSDASYNWGSFEHALPRLMEAVRSHCPNPHLQLAYMLPWTHTKKSTEKEWAGNISCARKIAKEYGLRVIPVGTAVQNARCQGLDNGMYLTRDNWHMCNGVGKFVATSALYEGLLSSFAKRSILDNPVIYEMTPEEASAKGAMALDENNARICKQCAFQAAEKPFETTVEQ